MAIRKSGISGIPFGNTAARPASPSLGQPYFNGEVGRLELYSSNGWQNIVQETPGIASASGTYNESAGSGTLTISGTNFVDGAIAYAVGTNGTEYQATTTTYNSLVQLTVLFSNLSSAYEPYDIKVVNPSNLFGLLPDAFYINDSPVWSTSSGSLGTYYSSVSIQLAATDDESNTITYSVTSGSLPTGLSLSSSGLISGTVTATPATYTFTVSASDGINTAVTRSFSIIVPFPTASGGTLTSDSTYYYRTFSAQGNFVVSSAPLNADIVIVAGGGGGGGANGGGGGGAGGLLALTSQSLSVSTYGVTIGAGGAAETDGNNSVFGSNTALKGAKGANSTTVATGGSGTYGSGGGTGRDLIGGISQIGGAGTSGQGFKGGDTPSGGNGGSGGGGAGGAGNNTSSSGAENATSPQGDGGIGSNVYSSWLSAIASGMTGVDGWSTATSSGYIAGGGGGSAYQTTRNPSGGAGGGGQGTMRDTGSTGSTAGITNTGSGGGGGGTGAFKSAPSSGGSGIVIVRYTKASVGG